MGWQRLGSQASPPGCPLVLGQAVSPVCASWEKWGSLYLPLSLVVRIKGIKNLEQSWYIASSVFCYSNFCKTGKELLMFIYLSFMHATCKKTCVFPPGVPWVFYVYNHNGGGREFYSLLVLLLLVLFFYSLFSDFPPSYCIL